MFLVSVVCDLNHKAFLLVIKVLLIRCLSFFFKSFFNHYKDVESYGRDINNKHSLL